MKQRRRFLLVVGVLTLAGWAQATTGADKTGEPAPTWVELGENGTIIARQVVEPKEGKCPSIQIDGNSIQMRKRGAPSPSFYVLVCEAVIPGNAASVSIEGIPLPLPKATIANIVVVGDTGCKGNTTGKRMKKVTPMEEPEDEEEEAAASPSAKPRKKTENCILKSVWPLPAIAKNAAAKKPDLVIHVGDYVYVTEEDWIQWKTQFFKPARDLLLAAPWIFIRGNHETCERHGPGYFYLLDPRKDASCPTGRDHTDPYLVRAGGSQFLVMDSSGANCDYTPSGPGTGCKVDDYSQEKRIWTGLFDQAKTLIGSGDVFLLTHRPLWGIKAPSPSCPLPPCLQPANACKGLPGRNLVAINSAMQEAYQQANMTGIKMVVSGHIHNFQLVTYQKQDSTDPLPQLVVGDSGVELAPPPPPIMNDCQLQAPNGYLHLSTFQGMNQFGFGVLQSDGSKFDLYLKNGHAGLKCTIDRHKANCATEISPSKH